MLTFQFTAEGPTVILTFNGRLDSVAVIKINEIIENEPLMKNRAAGQQIVFDLQAVEYISSAFIRVCISMARKAGNGNFSIANCQPFVKKIFKISGLDELFHIN
jgi:anti-anti-sigma factor